MAKMPGISTFVSSTTASDIISNNNNGVTLISDANDTLAQSVSNTTALTRFVPVFSRVSGLSAPFYLLMPNQGLADVQAATLAINSTTGELVAIDQQPNIPAQTAVSAIDNETEVVTSSRQISNTVSGHHRKQSEISSSRLVAPKNVTDGTIVQTNPNRITPGRVLSSKTASQASPPPFIPETLSNRQASQVNMEHSVLQAATNRITQNAKSNHATANNEENQLATSSTSGRLRSVDGVSSIAKGSTSEYWDSDQVTTDASIDSNMLVTSTRDEERVPLFLTKLWSILSDPAHHSIIRWDKSGTSFHIVDPYTFCRKVLPIYFKHNNMTSLVRQLNMYGFRKASAVVRSGLLGAESDHEHLEFSHPFFIRGNANLLSKIKRKSPVTARINDNNNSMIALPMKEVNLMFDEIRRMQEKMRLMESKVSHLVKENESVWEQLAQVRDLNMKQQHVVNKLVQFLVALVHPAQKQKHLRKRQLLAIDEIGGKRARLNGQSSTQSSQQVNNLVDMIDGLERELFENGNDAVIQNLFSPKSNRGPIIADVTDELEPIISEAPFAPGSSSAVEVTQAKIPQPAVNGESNELSSNLQAMLQLSPSLDRQISEELANCSGIHEQNIDNYRDLLSNCWECINDEDLDGEYDLQQSQTQQEYLEQQQQQQHYQLMLMPNDPLLALDDAPRTPQLLTPSTSPAPQHHHQSSS